MVCDDTPVPTGRLAPVPQRVGGGEHSQAQPERARIVPPRQAPVDLVLPVEGGQL